MLISDIKHQKEDENDPDFDQDQNLPKEEIPEFEVDGEWTKKS